MSASQKVTGHTGASGSLVRLGARVAIAAFATIAGLGVFQAWCLIGTHSEQQAAAEIQKLGGTVFWAWRLDDMMQQKQAAIDQAPYRWVPGDSFVASVYLTQCGERQLDDRLVSLERLPNLRILALTGAKISDATLSHISSLSHLEWLGLSNTPITDDGLRTLATLKGLKYLNLAGTHVTPRAVAALRGRLPSARIISDFDVAISAS